MLLHLSIHEITSTTNWMFCKLDIFCNTFQLFIDQPRLTVVIAEVMLI